MRDTLRDLYEHQAWADAEHWRALEARPVCFDDAALWRRLHHIHLVERAFLSLACGEAIVGSRPEDFTPPALRNSAREYHDKAQAFLASVSDARLAEPMAVPWFKEPPLELTVGQGLMQAALHSHYHRGQNATRLRELGGEPPLTDYIVWIWKRRPAPAWT